MPTLNLTTRALAFLDPQTSSVSSNPLRRNFDWTRSVQATVVAPKTWEEDALVPGASVTLFSATRATTLDGTTAWAITLSPLDPARYRFTWTGGTNPTLRTDRALTLSGASLAVVINLDQTATWTLSGGPTWGTVVAGDTIFVPGVSTGDPAGPMNVLNEGYWIVLAVLSSTQLQLSRPAGMAPQGVAETDSITSNSQISGFSASGVQTSDSVAITAGFTTATQRTFLIGNVTSKWFEVATSSPIPLQVGQTPGAAGMIFYSAAKRWLRIESTQEVSIQLNGISDNRLRTSPVQAGDINQTGWWEAWGAFWSATVVNMSSQVAQINAFSAE